MCECAKEWTAEHYATAEGEAAISRAIAQIRCHREAAPALAPCRHDLVRALSAAGETAFTWDITNDRLHWQSNVQEVLAVPSQDAISTSSGYQFLMDPEDAERRQSILLRIDDASAEGLEYRVQYRLMPLGRNGSISMWVEEHGRLWRDADGAPLTAAGVVRVVNDRHDRDLLLANRNDHDELTGQLSRSRFITALGSLIERSHQTRQPSALLIVAVNELAIVNETFGFDIGDQVIAAVGRILRQQLRAVDVVGRYSSNKFGIILAGCSPAAMRTAAERLLRQAREAVIETSVCKLSPSISIGGVIIPDQAKSAHEAITRGLHALAKSRLKFGSAFTVYEPSAHREGLRARKIAIANDVIAAVDTGRMRLALQPVISTRTGAPAFYECLLRIVHVDGSTVPAADFIGVAEQLGLSRLVDRRALELAVALLKRDPALKLALNVSGLTCTDHDWLVDLHRLTGGREVAERLTIEITETAAIQDIDQSSAFVDTLQDLGCRVAIDDFGAGYTSFQNLKHLDVDIVKIDGAFVKDLSRDSSDRVFIKAMVELAQHFGMETVAEWVSDADTARLLTEAGIDYLQGYHFGRPVTVDEAYGETGHPATGTG